MDGMRGLPDLRGEVRHCPRSNESITIDMKTPVRRRAPSNPRAVHQPTLALTAQPLTPRVSWQRVLHKHGQAVYFCCFGCVTAFWSEPKQYLA